MDGRSMSDLARPAPPAHPWDGYLIGPENALAHAGAMALARGDREGVSPLVVHGPAGSGKSRLLAGLVAERLLRAPGSAVGHLEAEAFAAACAEASGHRGGWAEVRDRFRRLDLFILDDLHALERAPWAMEELSHTLDALDEAGAAVAVVGDDPAPGKWSSWPTTSGQSPCRRALSQASSSPSLESRRRYLLDRARSPKAWPCPPRSSSRWPKRPTATGRSKAGWRSSKLSSRVEAPGVRPRPRRGHLTAATRSGGPTLDEIARAVADRSLA